VSGIILVKVIEQQVMFLFGEPVKLIFHAGSIGQDSATDKEFQKYRVQSIALT